MGAAIVAAATTLNLSAATLDPGAELNPVPDEGPVSGTKVAEMQTPFVALDFEGSLISTVLQDDASNPLGGLTFTYEIALDSGSLHGVSRMTVNSFANVLADVSYTDGSIAAGVPPVFSDRTSDGSVIQFTFPSGDGLPSGQSSALMVVQTDSANYAESFASFINADVTKADTFAPAVIPEPSMAALLLLGIGAFAFWNRWR